MNTKHKFEVEITGRALLDFGEADLLLSYGIISSFQQRKNFDEYYYMEAGEAHLSLQDLLTLSRDFTLVINNEKYLEVKL